MNEKTPKPWFDGNFLRAENLYLFAFDQKFWQAFTHFARNKAGNEGA